MSTPLSIEETLRRFLYIGNTFGCFATPTNERKVLKFEDSIIAKYIEENKEGDILEIMKEVNDDPLFIKRYHLFYMIAYLFLQRNLKPETRLTIRNSALNLCKNDEEFFKIIKYYVILKNNQPNRFPKPLRKLSHAFYKNKNEMELANSIARNSSYHGWKHKDVLKLAHFKFRDNAKKEMVLQYAIRKKFELKETHRQMAPEIYNFLKKSHALKFCTDPEICATLISELRANYKEVNSRMLKSHIVWQALLPYMSINQILFWLPKFYKLQLLTDEASPSCQTVMRMLINQNLVHESNIHPIEVFIHSINFGKGGRAKNPKLTEALRKNPRKRDKAVQEDIDCAHVSSQINKCLMLSYCNIESLDDKKIMIGVDITEKMYNKCHHNKNIVALEAAFTIVKWLLKMDLNTQPSTSRQEDRTQPNVRLGAFRNDSFDFIETTGPLYMFNSYQTFDQGLHERPSDYTLISTMMNKCSTDKIPVDIFINLLSSSKCSENAPKRLIKENAKPWGNLNMYRKNMRSPHTRMVNIFLTSHESVGTDGQRGILDILGFSNDVPRIVEAFCKGNFC